MKTITRAAEISTEIKRSRFIGRSFLEQIPAEALGTIERIRAAERDATHHCWAYRIGRDGEQARYSDDGEPQGTAGPPILEILKKSEITNALVIVTRYYGGIKLGAGGLARAYGDAAKRVLEESGIKELRLMAEIEAAVPYPLLGQLEHYLEREEAEITGKTFGEFVAVRLRIPADREADFAAFYARLTAGKSSLSVLGRELK
jgi:uncharacterized YigZ family protein